MDVVLKDLLSLSSEFWKTVSTMFSGLTEVLTWHFPLNIAGGASVLEVLFGSALGVIIIYNIIKWINPLY